MDVLLSAYVLDAGKTGKLVATDTLGVALSKIENAIAAAVAGNGEMNQHAFSVIRVDGTALAAATQADAVNLIAGD